MFLGNESVFEYKDLEFASLKLNNIFVGRRIKTQLHVSEKFNKISWCFKG